MQETDLPHEPSLMALHYRLLALEQREHLRTQAHKELLLKHYEAVKGLVDLLTDLYLEIM